MTCFSQTDPESTLSIFWQKKDTILLDDDSRVFIRETSEKGKTGI